ncbi:tetratricopeptide repeat protein, partial [bacterium]
AEYSCALGDLLVFSGRFGEAIEICRPLLATSGVPDALAARAGRVVFLCLSYTGQGAEAEVFVTQNRERFMVGRPAADVPPERLAAWLAFSPSWLDVLRNQGRIDESIRLADDMIALDRRLGSPDPIRTADLLTQRSTLLWQGTRYDEAIADLKASIYLYRKSGDELNAESRQNNLGLVYWSMGELKLAETNLKAARELYRRIGLDQMYIHTSGNLGLVHLFRGDMEQAALVLQEQMDMAKRKNFVSEYNRGRWNFAITRYYQGDACEAMQVYRSTLDYYETRGGRETYFSHWIWVAFCMDRQGEHEKAVALLRDVIDKAVEYQYPNLEQVALRGLARLLPRAEQETPLRRSLEMATRAGSRFE